MENEDKIEFQKTILEFRNKLKKHCERLSEYWGVYSADEMLDDYDEHFNITTARDGKI